MEFPKSVICIDDDVIDMFTGEFIVAPKKGCIYVAINRKVFTNGTFLYIKGFNEYIFREECFRDLEIMDDVIESLMEHKLEFYGVS